MLGRVDDTREYPRPVFEDLRAQSCPWKKRDKDVSVLYSRFAMKFRENLHVVRLIRYGDFTRIVINRLISSVPLTRASIAMMSRRKIMNFSRTCGRQSLFLEIPQSIYFSLDAHVNSCKEILEYWINGKSNSWISFL